MGSNIPFGVTEYLLLDDAGLVDQCDVDCYRSRGPGGQKRNKTSSAVRLRHQPTGLSVIASEDRSQHVNKTRAIRRLRAALALNLRTQLDPARYRPSDRLRECISPDGSFRVSKRDPSYHLAVCEILDLLAACDMAIRASADLLGMSTGQLIKLLGADRKLWGRANQMRAEMGVKPLRATK